MNVENFGCGYQETHVIRYEFILEMRTVCSNHLIYYDYLYVDLVRQANLVT